MILIFVKNLPVGLLNEKLQIRIIKTSIIRIKKMRIIRIDKKVGKRIKNSLCYLKFVDPMKIF